MGAAQARAVEVNPVFHRNSEQTGRKQEEARRREPGESRTHELPRSAALASTALVPLQDIATALAWRNDENGSRRGRPDFCLR